MGKRGQLSLLGGVLLGLLSPACVGTTYLPQVRENYATALLHNRVYLHIIQPQVKAISLTPPFACDAQTLALARDGLPPGREDPTEVEFFTSYDAIYWRGVYAVRTVAGLGTTQSGPYYNEGPWLYVITGDDSDHPAMSALNVVNRYNAVAKCLQAQP